MDQFDSALFFNQKIATRNLQRSAALHPEKHGRKLMRVSVTASTWAAHLKDCMIELPNTFQNPSKANPFPQEEP